MKFFVVFRNEAKHPIVSLKDSSLGRVWLKSVQNSMSVPTNRIGDFLPKMQETVVRVEVPEEKTAVSGHFEKTSVVTVTVPRLAINHFVVEKPVVEYHKDGSVSRVYPTRKLRKKDLLAAWIAAGHPTQWEIKEKIVSK